MRTGSAVLAGLGAIALLCTSAGAAAAPSCPALARLNPRNGWRALDMETCELCLFNRIRIGPGIRLRWNGAPIDEKLLATYLKLTEQMTPQPVTLISAAPGADCPTIGRISRLIERLAPCEGRFCKYGIAK